MGTLKEKIRNYAFVLFSFIPGGFYGLISISLAIIIVTLSYMNFPGYNIVYNDVSVLGIGPGLSAPLFNIGIILTGVFDIPFFIYLGKILQQEKDDKKLPKRTIYLSIIGCFSLSLVGCFPVINRVWGIIHATLEGIFFITSLVFLILFSRMMLNDKRFSRIHAYLGFIVAGLIGFYLATRWSIVEWIVFFAMGLWISDISIYTLYKRFKV